LPVSALARPAPQSTQAAYDGARPDPFDHRIHGEKPLPGLLAGVCQKPARLAGYHPLFGAESRPDCSHLKKN
jgi:hypothetical protein